MAITDIIRFKHKNVEAFPVGSIFLCADNINPSNLLGYCVWSLIGNGRTILGASNTDNGKKLIVV